MELTADEILSLHAALGCGDGGFRRIAVHCTEAVSGRSVAYVPPELVPRAVDACLARLNAALAEHTRDLEVVRAAAILWAELLARIHPFEDGNGRVVRALCQRLLGAVGLEISGYDLLLSIGRGVDLEGDVLRFQAALLASVRPCSPRS